tara:strand:+ start:75 stop:497 length:423 start_codon:yes stop_codon:yes gene_type:complete
MKLLESYKNIAKLFIIEDEDPEKEEPEDKKLDKGMDDEEDYEREFDEISLPITVKRVNSPKLKRAKTDPKSKRGKEFMKHHTLHNGPHIKGEPAEFSTYDFDDDDYEVAGGMQKRKNKQKRGYEPVESIQVNGKKYKRVS